MLYVIQRWYISHTRSRSSPCLRSLNPAWLVKRALYNLDDFADGDRKAKLTQGLKDAVTVAAKALEKMNDEKYRDKLNFWFGDKYNNDDGRMKVQGVLQNFVGSNADGTGSDTNGLVFVYSTDYYVPKKGDTGPADGTTPFCSLQLNGKTGTAYFKNNNNKPGMHFCDKVWERANLAALIANSCASLGDHVNTNTWSKNFIGANVFHEFMHYSEIGKKSVGKRIVDHAYDAYNCRALAADANGERRALTLLNADTYVFFVLDIAFSELCGKAFSGPRDGRDDDATNEDWPDTDPPAINPNGEICVCGESGCNEDSPECCGNGTC